MNEVAIDLWQLRKVFDGSAGCTVAVDDFTLKVREHEFICVIGHSGCGKSTVLSILMGLVPPTEGTVIVGGKEVTGPGCDRGVVFQSPALLPWLSARDNVLLAVEQANGRHTAEERRRIADRYLAQVGLEGLGNSMPDELSAGMRQRVGIARAFAVEPKVLLLDEPFSLLDALTRMELQDELVSLWQRTRKTVFMVTHDVDEALLLADRIVMMTPGPAGRIGDVLDVPFARPRVRATLLDTPAYFEARNKLIRFLECGTASEEDEQ